MNKKEALEIVRKNYPHVGFSGSEFETALRELIPELAESEDEWIRKHIIKILDSLAPCHWDGNEKARCIAYLERQKEQKYYTYEQSKQAAEDCYYDKGYNTEDDGRCNEQSFLWGFEEGVDWCEQQKERKPVDLSEMMVHKEPYIAPVPIPIVADEQQPAEWSEEDEKLLDAMIDMATNSLYEPLCPRGKMIVWLKSLRPQPKKELSIEKAIKWLDDTFCLLDNSSGRGRDSEIITHDFDSLEEMYDSFRKAVIVDSEPSWKPSEEQMEILQYLCEHSSHANPNVMPTLESLYHDLQKLL